MKKFAAILLGALLAGSAAFAAGHDVDKWYVLGGGGASFADETGFDDWKVDKDLPYGFKPLQFDFGSGSDTGYIVEAGIGRTFKNVFGGQFMAGFAFNYRGFDSDAGFDYSDSVNPYGDITKTLALQGHADADLSSIGFMFDMHYLVTQASYKGNGWSLYPLINVQVGAARNELKDITFSKSGSLTFSDGEESEAISGSLSGACDDTTNIDLAYAARAGVEAAIGESARVQIKGGYFNNGLFASPDRCWGMGSIEEWEFDFQKEMAEREQELDGWDILATVRVEF